MPDPINALAVLAEFGVGLAGFSGVVLVFASNPDNWAKEDRFRVENLLFFALIGAFCTLVAIGVAYTGLPQELCWRIASGILAFVMGWRVMVAAPVYRYIWSISPLGSAMSRSVAVFLIVTSSLVIALQLANASGLLPGSSFVYLYLGLLWPLLAAAVLFYRVIFYRPGGNADSPAAEANED